MFFYLRLIYERNSSFNSNSLCKWISGHTYAELANSMLTDPCLWGYSYMSADRYQTIKTTFTNTILFLRTWYEAAAYDADVGDSELVKVFNLLMDTSILFDWQQLLRASVKISNSITISIGSHASFSDVSFRGWNLNASNFDGSKFTGTNFSNANLAGASFRNCSLVDINFGGADLSEADFSGAVIQHCDFSSTKMDHTKFVSTRLQNIQYWPKIVSADFSKGKLTNLSWKGCNLENAKLDSTEICNSDLSSAKFGKIVACTFSNCGLRRAYFNGSQLDDVLFSDLSISNGNFDGAVLCNIEFQKIDLSGVSFRGAELTNIIFDNNTVWERTDFFRAMLDKQLVAALKAKKQILNLTRLAN